MCIVLTSKLNIFENLLGIFCKELKCFNWFINNWANRHSYRKCYGRRKKL